MPRSLSIIAATPAAFSHIRRFPRSAARVYLRGPDSLTNLSVYGFGVSGLWTAVGTVLLQFRILDFADEHYVGILPHDSLHEFGGRYAVLAVDLDGVFYGCRVAIPAMRARGGGAIVNTASISGLGGDWGFSAYSAAKGAVVNYSRTLALDHGKDNIRTNAICPGMIDTPMVRKAVAEIMPDDPQVIIDAMASGIPKKKLGTPEDIGELAAFLASDRASYITGQPFVIDGGSTLPESALSVME